MGVGTIIPIFLDEQMNVGEVKQPAPCIPCKQGGRAGMCTQLCLMPEHFASHICDSFVCKKAPWRARLYDWDPPLTSPSGKSHCGYHYCKGPSEMAFGATQTLLPPMVKSMVLIPAFCSGTGGECWGRARVEGSAFLSGVTQIKTVMKRHVRSQYEAYS